MQNNSILNRENANIATKPLTPVSTEHQTDPSRKSSSLTLWYGLCLLLAAGVYFYALGSMYIPKNGDEYVYAHITRLTAHSGHLLPLVSQQINMRNTKPPLLFWQGIASTHWAQEWSLFRLRYPSVLYTLLTALLAFLLARKWSGSLGTGFLAAVTYLSFANTYRYGRPFLTEAPLMFWMFLSVFVFVFWLPATMESAVVVPLAIGLVVGVGALYKSFVLVLPVSLALSWWYMDQRGFRIVPFLKKDAWRIAITALVALALFCVWFLLDPKPGEVFQEFVLKENVGRFDVGNAGYLHYLLKGGSSIWAYALGFFVNTGVLIFPMFALCWMGFKERRNWSAGEKFLWIWAASLLLIFGLPSMRSSRYLLPSLPGIGVLFALNWNRISRKAFVASLIAGAGLLAGLVYLCLRLQFNLSAPSLFPLRFWVVVTTTVTVILSGLLFRTFTRHAVPAVALLMFLCLAMALRPLDGPIGQFSLASQQYAKGKQVWVPANFRAMDEGYRFLLPQSDVYAYSDDKTNTFDALKSRYPMFAYGQPLSAQNPSGVLIVGERLKLHSRHTKSEIYDMLRGNVFEHIFLREILVEIPGAPQLANPVSEGGR